MSLVGFRSQNHPQQPRKDSVDDRWTPLNLWIPWNDRWQFTLDAAASDENHLCERYFTLEQDGLKQSWAGERVWVNPPYSDMRAWVEKAWSEWDDLDYCWETSPPAPRQRQTASVIVMLAPANRTEQRWWQESIEPNRDRGGCLKTEFLPRRINFGSLDNLGAWSASSAPFGCVLLVWSK